MKVDVVIMMCEPKDVVASTKNRAGSLDADLQRRLRDNSASIAYYRTFEYFIESFEDLVTQPCETLKQICGFLGVKLKQTDGKGEQDHLQNRALQMTQSTHDRRGIWKELLTE
ncbi:MAG: sulfotransferase [Chromatiaceae bacterium]|nr:sulfotransferase [Chromatiaceae bacterium]